MIKSSFNVTSVRLLLTGRIVCGNHMTKGMFFKIGWSQKIYRDAQIRSRVDLSWVTLDSVRNRSGIIAQYGVSNAKPSMVNLILRLPETNFR